MYCRSPYIIFIIHNYYYQPVYNRGLYMDRCIIHILFAKINILELMGTNINMSRSRLIQYKKTPVLTQPTVFSDQNELKNNWVMIT